MQYRFEIKPKLEKKLKKIFEIDEDEKMVRFLDLDHHDEIYRKRY